MGNFENRLLADTKEVREIKAGVTWDTFKAWAHQKQQRYLGDHPESSFYDRLGIPRPGDKEVLRKHGQAGGKVKTDNQAELDRLYEEQRKTRDQGARRTLDKKIKKLEDQNDQSDLEHSKLNDSLEEKRKAREEYRKGTPQKNIKQIHHELKQKHKEVQESLGVLNALKKKHEKTGATRDLEALIEQRKKTRELNQQYTDLKDNVDDREDPDYDYSEVEKEEQDEDEADGKKDQKKLEKEKPSTKKAVKNTKPKKSGGKNKDPLADLLPDELQEILKNADRSQKGQSI